MQQGWSERGSATQCQNSLGHETDAGRETEQEKTHSRRTTSEVREESPHDEVSL